MNRRERIERSPFFILGVDLDASRIEIERSAQKLLGLLAIGASAAKRYVTPMGERERTEDDVRSAVAALRDPASRVLHELWATSPDVPDASPEASPDVSLDLGELPSWDDALVALGFASRRREP